MKMMSIILSFLLFTNTLYAKTQPPADEIPVTITLKDYEKLQQYIQSNSLDELKGAIDHYGTNFIVYSNDGIHASDSFDSLAREAFNGESRSNIKAYLLEKQIAEFMSSDTSKGETTATKFEINKRIVDLLLSGETREVDKILKNNGINNFNEFDALKESNLDSNANGFKARYINDLLLERLSKEKPLLENFGNPIAAAHFLTKKYSYSTEDKSSKEAIDKLVESALYYLGDNSISSDAASAFELYIRKISEQDPEVISRIDYENVAASSNHTRVLLYLDWSHPSIVRNIDIASTKIANADVAQYISYRMEMDDQTNKIFYNTVLENSVSKESIREYGSELNILKILKFHRQKISNRVLAWLKAKAKQDSKFALMTELAQLINDFLTNSSITYSEAYNKFQDDIIAKVDPNDTEFYDLLNEVFAARFIEPYTLDESAQRALGCLSPTASDLGEMLQKLNVELIQGLTFTTNIPNLGMVKTTLTPDDELMKKIIPAICAEENDITYINDDVYEQYMKDAIDSSSQNSLSNANSRFK